MTATSSIATADQSSSDSTATTMTATASLSSSDASTTLIAKTSQSLADATATILTATASQKLSDVILSTPYASASLPSAPVFILLSRKRPHRAVKNLKHLGTLKVKTPLHTCFVKSYIARQMLNGISVKLSALGLWQMCKNGPKISVRMLYLRLMFECFSQSGHLSSYIQTVTPLQTNLNAIHTQHPLLLNLLNSIHLCNILDGVLIFQVKFVRKYGFT